MRFADILVSFIKKHFPRICKKIIFAKNTYWNKPVSSLWSLGSCYSNLHSTSFLFSNLYWYEQKSAVKSYDKVSFEIYKVLPVPCTKYQVICALTTKAASVYGAFTNRKQHFFFFFFFFFFFCLSVFITVDVSTYFSLMQFSNKCEIHPQGCM